VRGKNYGEETYYPYFSWDTALIRYRHPFWLTGRYTQSENVLSLEILEKTEKYFTHVYIHQVIQFRLQSKPQTKCNVIGLDFVKDRTYAWEGIENLWIGLDLGSFI